jgi:hypothetical protein
MMKALGKIKTLSKCLKMALNGHKSKDRIIQIDLGINYD